MRPQAFLDRLAAFVTKQDIEIEKTCNQNYQVRGAVRVPSHCRTVRTEPANGGRARVRTRPGPTHARPWREQAFVVSVDQLLSTRQVAHKLKTKIVELNELVQGAGRDVADKVPSLRALHVLPRPPTPSLDLLPT